MTWQGSRHHSHILVHPDHPVNVQNIVQLRADVQDTIQCAMDVQNMIQQLGEGPYHDVISFLGDGVPRLIILYVPMIAVMSPMTDPPAMVGHQYG